MQNDTLRKPLTSRQKKYLRKLGHGLAPVVQIGKEGLSERVLQAIDEALSNHELIKCRIINSEVLHKRQAAELVPARTGSALVQLIGKTLLLYRRSTSRKSEERIVLPPG